MKTLPLIVASAALVTACGGGGGGPAFPQAPTNVSGTEVPLSATQNADAAFQFVSTVAARKSETADPLLVGDATLATTDTEEPQPL